jgi:hypothetical protein
MNLRCEICWMKTSEAFRSMIAHNCWVGTDKDEINGASHMVRTLAAAN